MFAVSHCPGFKRRAHGFGVLAAVLCILNADSASAFAFSVDVCNRGDMDLYAFEARAAPRGFSLQPSVTVDGWTPIPRGACRKFSYGSATVASIGFASRDGDGAIRSLVVPPQGEGSEHWLYRPEWCAPAPSLGGQTFTYVMDPASPLGSCPDGMMPFPVSISAGNESMGAEFEIAPGMQHISRP